VSEYFDTPALVFACGKSAFAQSARKLIADSTDPVTIPHAIAECFNSLTYRLGFPPRLVRDSLRSNLKRFRFVTLDAADYHAALDRLIEHGLTGDKIFDALHVGGAIKVGAEKIYTSNKRDFGAMTDIPIERIGP
jgi:predicted nucleic acid-binding protein